MTENNKIDLEQENETLLAEAMKRAGVEMPVQSDKEKPADQKIEPAFLDNSEEDPFIAAREQFVQDEEVLSDPEQEAEHPQPM